MGKKSGGRGVIFLGGISLRVSCPWGELFRGNFLGGKVQGLIVLGGNCWGGSCPGAIVWRVKVLGEFHGGQLSRGELSLNHLI